MKSGILSTTEQNKPLAAMLLGLCVLLLLPPAVHAEKRILKWTDKNGVVHYGDVIPAQATGRGSTELNKQGVRVKKNQAFKKQDPSSYSTRNEQLRKDSALLASYSSIEEIKLAMARNVTAEANRLTGLKKRYINATEILKEAKTLKAAKLARNLKPSQYLEDKIAATQKKVDKTQSEITATQNNIALIKQRFAAYQARYAELRPRNQTLSAIKVNTRNLAELEDWKREANEKLSFYLHETVKYKREGREVPKDIVRNIQSTNREIARADQEIAYIKASIRNSQQTFTSK